ncbi:carboxypeptidase-like regulatory domain-containing protein [Sediminibacterium roseum]|uniref:Carboxypeptidase-like regulatory domain-containing protein n=1 Tax=Sediminibacterium roseum TaxID=1978412 RepID=A0ABW9ZV09_9BACT|nr:carboxypeptidase-like regulatory domain-containing protein [Sediminibacterium roseum]NCI51002.1 carboxypeptidase-like regulatory domain-containing protein [Sediminibacterium roseum]
MRKLLLLLCSSFLMVFAQAQKTMSGRIFSQDKTPVAAANIYLSNTSKGTVSDENGVFVLRNFPEGKYELIISCVGFELFRTLIGSDQSLDNVVVYLKPKTEELKEVVVANDPYDPYGWSRYGHFFMDNFIGTESFASECTLVNKEALRFRYSPRTDLVKITAKEDLVIENNALGYILKYTLVNFEYSLSTKQFIYRGYPFFTEMQSTDKRLEKKWKENRDKVYKGSLLHFMRSTYRDKIAEEQFEVREIAKISKMEKQRVREMFDRQSKKKLSNSGYIHANESLLFIEEKDTARIINKDTLAYFQSVMKQIRQEEILIDIKLGAKNIASDRDHNSKQLIFPNRIEVVYLPKIKYPDYQKTLPDDQKFNPVVSHLMNVPEHLVFLSNGSFYGENIVGVKGFWSWSEKMCTKLPYDYEP